VASAHTRAELHRLHSHWWSMGQSAIKKEKIDEIQKNWIQVSPALRNRMTDGNHWQSLQYVYKVACQNGTFPPLLLPPPKVLIFVYFHRDTCCRDKRWCTRTCGSGHTWWWMTRKWSSGGGEDVGVKILLLFIYLTQILSCIGPGGIGWRGWLREAKLPASTDMSIWLTGQVLFKEILEMDSIN
jgi:hypothetical protein